MSTIQETKASLNQVCNAKDTDILYVLIDLLSALNTMFHG